MDMGLNKLREMVKDWEDWWAAVHGVKKSQTRLSDWITHLSVQVLSTQALLETLKLEPRDSDLAYPVVMLGTDVHPWTFPAETNTPLGLKPLPGEELCGHHDRK